ncbi:MAG: sigma-54-dependent Fis family transcriptional regulator [Planctomycetota bacterium]|nr:MAG: sigma-54-dependent Fis family transcriptional regulator [Planctomycetota bacterium]
MRQVLIVEDEARAREALEKTLGKKYKVFVAGDGAEGLEIAEREDIDLVLSDIRMPKMDGMEFLEKLKASKPDVEIVMITAYGTIETAVTAMKQGAYDFLTKPLNIDHVRVVVKKALEKRGLVRENLRLQAELAGHRGIGNMVGRSAPMKEVADLISRVAPTKATVLITGESGTGKELVADAIHAISPRAKKPLVKVNCASLAEALLESELFGHMKGAFTGAIADKKGRFEVADGGTVFLDEIGDISPSVQIRLLRVLQDKSFERVGGNKTISVDVRIVSATNQDIKAKIESGEFREDLYYRLHVVTIPLPPLRERSGDVPLLAEFFRKKFAEENDKKVESIHPKAMAMLDDYSWPGNVRELEHVIESALVLSRSNTITPDLLPPGIQKATRKTAAIDIPVGSSLADAEKILIKETLSYTGGNKTKAAKLLGIGTRTLYRKLEAYGISK